MTTEHLPECPKSDVRGIALYGDQCLCPVLRACEQRVLDDDVLAAAHHGQKGYEVGFRKGLDAAREAVERVRHWDGYDEMTSETYLATDKDFVLSAIDTLREEQ